MRDSYVATFDRSTLGEGDLAVLMMFRMIGRS